MHLPDWGMGFVMAGKAYSSGGGPFLLRGPTVHPSLLIEFCFTSDHFHPQIPPAVRFHNIIVRPKLNSKPKYLVFPLFFFLIYYLLTCDNYCLNVIMKSN
jgi:hypothetical protein